MRETHRNYEINKHRKTVTKAENRVRKLRKTELIREKIPQTLQKTRGRRPKMRQKQSQNERKTGQCSYYLLYLIKQY